MRTSHLVVTLVTALSLFSCNKKKESKEASPKKTEKSTEEGVDSTNTQKIEEITGPAVIDNFLIRDNKAGFISLGTTVDNLSLPDGYKVEPMNVRNKAGMTEIYFVLKKEGSDKPLVTMKTDCFKSSCPIIDIYISDPNFSTSSGITVGSSFQQIESFYTITDLMANDYGNVYVYVEENRNVSFELQGVKDVHHNERYPADKVSPNTLISKIRVTNEEI